MRLALIPVATLALAACQSGPADATPERGNAAGEVLGGEASDAMLPLDTVRSTSPAEPARSTTPEATPGQDAQAEPTPVLPRPKVSGGPEPYVPSGIEDTPVPTSTPE